MNINTVEAVQIDNQIAEVAARVREGMVKISNGRVGSGAGSIIHPDGLIVTNSHVMQAERVKVHIGADKVMDGRLLAREQARDLAAVFVEANELPIIPMGDSNDLRPGELVFSLGYPWGVDGGLTYGVLIHVGPWPLENPRSGMDLLTASLHLRPGHSGGPMFNSRGEMIGLNTMMQGPDVGVAVPINRAKQFLKEAFEAVG